MRPQGTRFRLQRARFRLQRVRFRLQLARFALQHVRWSPSGPRVAPRPKSMRNIKKQFLIGKPQVSIRPQLGGNALATCWQPASNLPARQERQLDPGCRPTKQEPFARRSRMVRISGAVDGNHCFRGKDIPSSCLQLFVWWDLWFSMVIVRLAPVLYWP